MLSGVCRKSILADVILGGLLNIGSVLLSFFNENKNGNKNKIKENDIKDAAWDNGFLAALPQNSAEPHIGLSERQALEQTEKALALYGDAVLRAAYTYLHNMHDAEDIVQETFLRLFNSTAVFESEEHEKAWLLRVAINLSKNKLKSAWFRKNKLQADDFSDLAEDGDDIAELQFVWEAVKKLPVKYREVIHLFYQEGYATAEIASLLGKKEPTVRSLLSRGRKLLREILREEYDFDE